MVAVWVALRPGVLRSELAETDSLPVSHPDTGASQPPAAPATVRAHSQHPQ